MARRVVITGLGTVNALSQDLPTFFAALVAGKSGVGPITLFDVSAYKVKFGGEVRGFQAENHIDRKTARHLDRYAQFAVVAAWNAMKDSGLDMSREDATRCGV